MGLSWCQRENLIRYIKDKGILIINRVIEGDVFNLLRVLVFIIWEENMEWAKNVGDNQYGAMNMK